MRAEEGWDHSWFQRLRRPQAGQRHIGINTEQPSHVLMTLLRLSEQATDRCLVTQASGKLRRLADGPIGPDGGLLIAPGGEMGE